MATIRKEIMLDARPDDVWDALRDFHAVHERLVPGFVIDSRPDGDNARIVTFFNGAVVREVLVGVDEDAAPARLPHPRGIARLHAPRRVRRGHRRRAGLPVRVDDRRTARRVGRRDRTDDGAGRRRPEGDARRERHCLTCRVARANSAMSGRLSRVQRRQSGGRPTRRRSRSSAASGSALVRPRRPGGRGRSSGARGAAFAAACRRRSSAAARW